MEICICVLFNFLSYPIRGNIELRLELHRNAAILKDRGDYR